MRFAVGDVGGCVEQDAWRKCQTPASVNLGELGEDEWEVIRDTEDEQVQRLIVVDSFVLDSMASRRCPSPLASRFGDQSAASPISPR